MGSSEPVDLRRPRASGAAGGGPCVPSDLRGSGHHRQRRRYCQMLWMEFLAAASFTVTGRAAAEPLRGGLRSFHPPSLRSQIDQEARPLGACQACLPSGFGWGVMKAKRLRRRRLHFACPTGCKKMPVHAAISFGIGGRHTQFGAVKSKVSRGIPPGKRGIIVASGCPLLSEPPGAACTREQTASPGDST